MTTSDHRRKCQQCRRWMRFKPTLRTRVPRSPVVTELCVGCHLPPDPRLGPAQAEAARTGCCTSSRCLLPRNALKPQFIRHRRGHPHFGALATTETGS